MSTKTPYTVIDIAQVGDRLKPSVSYTKVSNNTIGRIPKATGQQPTGAPLPDQAVRQWRWARWGGYDDVPTVIRQKVNQVPIAGRTIYDLVRMAMGNGLCYYRNQQRTEGNTITRHYDTEIERWLRRNRIEDKWLIPQLFDYRHCVNTFSELIFNRRGDAVANIFHKPAEFCRLSQQDEQTFYSKYMLYSPYFATQQYPADDDIRAIPLYHFWMEEEIVEQARRRGKMAWHSCLETPGRVYYSNPPWLGLFKENGWMDASSAVPEIVTAMMKNQVRLKYQILIPESYFTIRYRDSWATMGDEERSKKIDTLVADINDMLSNTSNAYQSLVTIFNYDNVTKTELGKVQVIAVDDKVKKDEWVPSSEKSDAQIVQSLGGHPSHVGLAPEGGKMGTGSGSDKREMYNIEISSNTMDQNILLEPLNWIARFNAQADPRWDITFFIDHTRHTTTNKEEDGMERNTDTNLIVE